MEILLPLLISSKDEVESITDSPESFLSYCLELVEKQESSTYKVYALQLLEKICEHLESTLQFTAGLTFELITYVINGRKPNPQLITIN